MALIKKYDASANTKTHGLIDGTLVDLINPSSPLDSTGELMRMAAVGVGAWLFRGKKETGNFGF